MSATTCSLRSNAASSGSSSPPIPTEVADDDVALAKILRMTATATPARAPRRRSPARAVRLTTVISPPARATVDDCPCCSSAAENADMTSFDRNVACCERCHEPGTVGAVALQPPVTDGHDRVDAAQSCRRRVELVDERGDRFLCGIVTDRPPRPSTASHRAQPRRRPARPRMRCTPNRRPLPQLRRCAARATGCDVPDYRSPRQRVW